MCFEGFDAMQIGALGFCLGGIFVAMILVFTKRVQ